MERACEAREYRAGTCFTCQVCFRCGSDISFEETCDCDKNKKVPVKKKPTNDVKTYVFNCHFDPNDGAKAKAKKVLLTQSDKLYGYGKDFAQPFSCYLCGHCNNNLVKLTRDERQHAAQLQQLMQQHEGNNTDIQEEEEIPQDQKHGQQRHGKTSKDGKKPQRTKRGAYNDGMESENEDEKSGRKEHEAKVVGEAQSVSSSDLSDNEDEMSVSFKCSIKQGKNKPTAAKWVTLVNPTYEMLEQKIRQIVYEEIGHELDQDQYSLEYKGAGKHGMATALAEQADFARFLAEHARLEMLKKEMVLLIVVKDVKQKRQKHKYTKDIDSSSSASDTPVSGHDNRKKGKRHKIPKVSHLNDEEAELASLTNKLLEKYRCSSHTSKVCINAMNQHLTLTPTQVKLWAMSIHVHEATLDDPPTWSIFWTSGGNQCRSSSTSFIPSDRSATQEPQHSHKACLPTPDNSFVLFPAPSLENFLLECDAKYGKKTGEYFKFLGRLEEEAISVQHFKKLTTEEFANLGITKTGWVLNLREAAAQYE